MTSPSASPLAPNPNPIKLSFVGNSLGSLRVKDSAPLLQPLKGPRFSFPDLSNPIALI